MVRNAIGTRSKPRNRSEPDDERRGDEVVCEGVNFALKAPFIRRHAPKMADGAAWHLELRKSGYVEFNRQITPWAGFLLRMKQRDPQATPLHRRHPCDLGRISCSRPSISSTPSTAWQRLDTANRRPGSPW